MRLTVLVAPFLLIGCQEYTIDEGAPPAGEANPAELENPTNVDRIVQVTTPSVDVLWVVDNSGSMDAEQTQLADNFPVFMPYFLGSGLDYHIGVTSTDMKNNGENGRLVAADNGDTWIDVDSNNPEAMFIQMARLGIGGSPTEKGRFAAFKALETHKNGANQGFLRDDRGAGIHTIVVSDEPDLTQADDITKAEFIEWMNDLRPDNPELTTFSSIVNPPGGGIARPSGIDYLEITDGVGGIKWDIGSDNWISVLEQLAIQAAGLKREYFLSQLPVDSTIEVQVQAPDGDVITGQDWEYSVQRNSIMFETFVPEPLSQVLIQYTVLSSMVDTVDAPE